MPPAVFLLALLTTVGIAAFTVIKVASLFAAKRGAVPGDVAERLEELESDVQGLREELSAAQERIDFAERLLSSARDDKR